MLFSAEAARATMIWAGQYNVFVILIYFSECVMFTWTLTEIIFSSSKTYKATVCGIH